MANYIIIGGDGKEYGPVTDADVRQWIAEGRLNAYSRAKGEGDAEFRTLAQFPEFAGALGLNLPPPSLVPPALGSAGQGSARDAALQAVKAPAICLKVVAGLSFILSLWGIVKLVFFRKVLDEEMSRMVANYPQLQDAQVQKMLDMIYGPIGIGSNLFAAVVSVIIFWGATRMQQLRSFELCFIAVILAMLPCATNCCAWVFGLPLGIWALVVLNRSGVKSQFN